MRRIATGLVLTGLLLGAPVWAGDQEAGTYDESDMNTATSETTQEPGVASGLSDDSVVVEEEDITAVDDSTGNTVADYEEEQVITEETPSLVQDSTQTQGQDVSEAGTAEYTGTTVAEETPAYQGQLNDEIFAVRPNAGLMVYNDALGDDTSRAIYGLTMDWNMTSMFSDSPRGYAGISTGGLFSHVGSASSGFFGTDPDSVVNSPGANTIIIPANIKLGYHVTDNVRISARGGGNLTYRSEGQSMNLGPSTQTTSSIWRMYPNVGADFDFGLAPGISLGLRPDLTFTPGDDIFIGTLALGVALG